MTGDDTVCNASSLIVFHQTGRLELVRAVLDLVLIPAVASSLWTAPPQVAVCDPSQRHDAPLLSRQDA